MFVPYINSTELAFKSSLSGNTTVTAYIFEQFFWAEGKVVRKIQVPANACAMVIVSMSVIGIASGQRVKRSTIVRQ